MERQNVQTPLPSLPLPLPPPPQKKKERRNYVNDDGACISGVEVSLKTQNALLDLAAHHLGNMSAEEALEPVKVKENTLIKIIFNFSFFNQHFGLHAF